MEIVDLKKKTFKNVLSKFERAINRLVKIDKQNHWEYTDCRDIVIKRFDYSTDLFWRLLGSYMRDELGIILERKSPKGILSEALDQKLISAEEHELCIQMIEERNRTSHTYNEDLAEMVVGSVPKYFKLMDDFLTRIY